MRREDVYRPLRAIRLIKKRPAAVCAALSLVFALCSAGAVAADDGIGKLSLGINGGFIIMPNANKFAAVYSETNGFVTTTTAYSTKGNVVIGASPFVRLG